ncbi:MAG: hypothetical protein EXR47_03165 [Dehalococcoidia bacterium]|nr:hypothetical protein [Dehalococcoidia bacterium]
MKERLLALGEEYATDDFVIVTVCHRFKDRLRSYKLLAEAFWLNGEAPSATPGASLTPSASAVHSQSDGLGNTPLQ